jgi:hypothetical protein
MFIELENLEQYMKSADAAQLEATHKPCEAPMELEATAGRGLHERGEEL